MMSKENDGGPAFPNPKRSIGIAAGKPVYDNDLGMSLRDWFAGQVCMGLMVNREYKPSDGENARIAARCFALADVMVEEHEKE